MRLPNEEKNLVCQDCGTGFTALRNGIKRCPACKLAAALAHGRRDRPERRVPADRVLVCQGCGAKFQAHRSDAKWCQPCQVARALAHGSRPRPERQQRKAVVRRICSDCHQEFMGDLKLRRCDDCRRAEHLASARRSAAKRDYNLCPKCGGRKYKLSKLCRECAERPVLVARSGADHPNWRGGRFVSKQGYMLVRIVDAKGKPRYRAEHLLVWEAVNGPVPPGQLIHHINGIKTDNRIENLVATTRQGHRHRDRMVEPYADRVQVLEDRIRDLEARLSELDPMP